MLQLCLWVLLRVINYGLIPWILQSWPHHSILSSLPFCCYDKTPHKVKLQWKNELLWLMVSKLRVNGQLAPLDGNAKEMDLEGRKDVKRLMATGKQKDRECSNQQSYWRTHPNFLPLDPTFQGLQSFTEVLQIMTYCLSHSLEAI